MGDTERFLCLGAPQGTAQYQTHLCKGPEKEMLCSGSKVVPCGVSLECVMVTVWNV